MTCGDWLTHYLLLSAVHNKPAEFVMLARLHQSIQSSSSICVSDVSSFLVAIVRLIPVSCRSCNSYYSFFTFFFLLFWFFEIGFLCITTLVVLELALVDQAGLELRDPPTSAS